MLLHYIITVYPKKAVDQGYDEDEHEYHSASYYAKRFESGHYSLERLWPDFTTLQKFKREVRNWNIDTRNPSALLTVLYDEKRETYSAMELYIINSLHPEFHFEFVPPVRLANSLFVEEDRSFSPGF